MLAVSAQISVYGPEATFAVPERNGTTGRPRTVARPDRKHESVPALAERLPAEAFTTVSCRTPPAGEDVEGRFAFVRVVATHPRPQRPPAAALGVAAHRIARGRRGAERLLALEPARERKPGAARPPRPPTLDDRARPPTTQRRARTQPPRGPQLRRLSPPHRAPHLHRRFPHPRAPMPESPAAGLTLPQPLPLLQPLLRCRASRYRTSDQPVNPDQPILVPPREQQSPTRGLM